MFAFADLLNRALDKPKEQFDVNIDASEALMSKLTAAQRRYDALTKP